MASIGFKRKFNTQTKT